MVSRLCCRTWKYTFTVSENIYDEEKTHWISLYSAFIFILTKKTCFTFFIFQKIHFTIIWIIKFTKISCYRKFSIIKLFWKWNKSEIKFKHSHFFMVALKNGFFVKAKSIQKKSKLSFCCLSSFFFARKYSTSGEENKNQVNRFDNNNPTYHGLNSNRLQKANLWEHT